MIRFLLSLSLLISAVVPAFAGEEDLSKAFQRELVFLSSQKEALISARENALEGHKKAISQLEAELRRLEVVAVKATAANDMLYEQVQGLEKEKKEIHQRDSSLLSIYKKSLKVLSEVDHSLKLDLPGKQEPPLPSQATVGLFGEVKERSLAALKGSEQVVSFHGTYLNRSGELTEGSLLRFGRVGAHAMREKESLVVGPGGDGTLVELESVSAGQELVPIFLFESLLDKSTIRKKATWVDKIADTIPLIMLGFMLLMVLGLFVLFARE